MTATITANRLLVVAALWLSCLALAFACSNDDAPSATETPDTSGSGAGGTGAMSAGETSTPERTPSATRTPVATATPAATATPDLGLILPDIQTTDSDELYISFNAGLRFLHFSTEVHNVGTGSLQLVGATPENAEATTAWQVIEKRTAGEFERNVGVLQMNDAHGHWHLDDFATYELWTHADDGELDTLVASSGKVTFCLIDEFPLEPDNYGDGPRFGPCDPYAQGISPGWGETYEAWLPGQSLDITDLPDGGYALRTTLDPSGLLLEADTSNNVHVMYIVIDGGSVEPAVPLAEDESGVDTTEGEPPL